MSQRILRNLNECQVKGCKGKPKKTHFKSDEFNSEICDSCSDVVSYIRSIQTQSTPRKQKTVKEQSQIIELVSLEGIIEINKHYNEKCEATMSRMPDNSVNYVFTSPPYNVSLGVDGKKYGGKNSYQDNMTQQQYYEWNVLLIEEFLRITTHHVFYNNQILTDNKMALFALIGHFADRIKEVLIWDKQKRAPASAKGMFDSEFELMLIFSNIEPQSRVFPDANFAGNEGTGMSNIVRVRPTKNNFTHINKAVFPLNLPRTIIRAFGQEGDIWYDPFGGTGTTAEACIEEHRNFILSEMSTESVQKAIIPRIAKKQSQNKLFKPEQLKML